MVVTNKDPVVKKKTNLRRCRTSMMARFEKVVNYFYLLTIFTEKCHHRFLE